MAAISMQPGGREIPVWPPGQAIQKTEVPDIYRVVFADTDAYHGGLIDRILALENSERRQRFFRGACGTKIHHVHTFGVPEATLVDARARTLFRTVLGAEDAVVDLCWANVYRQGDYCMPHSHVRATASIVYCLDAGETDPDDELSGRLCIVDPRIGKCCQEEDGRMTTPFVPVLNPGTMLIFPGGVVHAVNPYGGSRPRITLSWNINAQALPGKPLTGADQGVAGNSAPLAGPVKN